LDEMLRQNEEREAELQRTKTQNHRYKRMEFDWRAKEREYKALLPQYRELRENNAKLTLTYFTLQCEYDTLKRDYDERASLVMNYGDYQINLSNPLLDMGHDGASSNNSSNRNLFAMANQSSYDQQQQARSGNMQHPHAIGGGGGALDVLSDMSNEDDDDVDMVVSFMTDRNSQVINEISMATLMAQQSGHQQQAPPQTMLSPAQSQSHQHTTSTTAAMHAQYAVKSREELIEDVVKLRDKLSEMTDTKLSLLQSTKQEIDRLTSKVRWLEEKEEHSQQHDRDDIYSEIQFDAQFDAHGGGGNGSERKQRMSFGGGSIGIMNNEEHSYKVSRNDLAADVKQLVSKQHKRAESMANAKYLIPPNTVTPTKDDVDKGSAAFDEEHCDDDGDGDNSITAHHKSLTFVDNN